MTIPDAPNLTFANAYPRIYRTSPTRQKYDVSQLRLHTATNVKLDLSKRLHTSGIDSTYCGKVCAVYDRHD
jgi:hypothetical protein